MDNYGSNMWSGYNSYNAFSPQPFSNVYKVTSAEEAVMRTNQRNSDMVYFDQDKNLFYRVKVDMDGRKSYATFTYTIPEPQAPVTNLDLNSLNERISKLEKMFENKKEDENGKLDG